MVSCLSCKELFFHSTRVIIKENLLLYFLILVDVLKTGSSNPVLEMVPILSYHATH